MFYIDNLRCFAPIAKKLTLVEEELRSYLASDIPIVRKLSEHISKGKGKRLRPALLLLCSRLFGANAQNDVKFATIYTATLILR